MPASLLDVGVESALGTQAGQEPLAQERSGKPAGEVEQWQAVAARVLI